CSSCDLVLTEVQGSFTSPCYPQLYPNSQSCRWTMQAPAGFVIQLTFLDFNLEESSGCNYDSVVVATGSGDIKFCGPTANGLTLNSTGNVMKLRFTSDFSVQKKGFAVSFKRVAVALRNQKVLVTSGNSHVTELSDSVSMPTLSQFTLCLEVERLSDKQVRNHLTVPALWLRLTPPPHGPPLHSTKGVFTYSDANDDVALSIGTDGNGMQLVVDGVSCLLDPALAAADIALSMKMLCFTWASASGQVGVYSDSGYNAKACPVSAGHTVASGGHFRLGGQSGQHNFNGHVYNLRLWDFAMTTQQLQALSCDQVGNVVDWDNSYWNIPSSLAQTDTALSCSVSVSTNPPVPTSCDPPGPGCPAASSTASTNTNHATNATSNARGRGPEPGRVLGSFGSKPVRRPRDAPGSLTAFPPGKTSRHLSFPPKDPGSKPSTSAPGPPGPPEPVRPLVGPSRSSSLGFISTPLIWPGRKRPSRGRPPSTSRGPTRPVDVTKPTAEHLTVLSHTPEPTQDWSTSGQGSEEAGPPSLSELSNRKKKLALPKRFLENQTVPGGSPSLTEGTVDISGGFIHGEFHQEAAGPGTRGPEAPPPSPSAVRPQNLLTFVGASSSSDLQGDFETELLPSGALTSDLLLPTHEAFVFKLLPPAEGAKHTAVTAEPTTPGPNRTAWTEAQKADRPQGTTRGGAAAAHPATSAGTSECPTASSRGSSPAALVGQRRFPTSTKSQLPVKPAGDGVLRHTAPPVSGPGPAKPWPKCACTQRSQCPCRLSPGNKGLFYRVSFAVEDVAAALSRAEVEEAVASWLNQTFQNWTHAVAMDHISVITVCLGLLRVQPVPQSPTRYGCQALLVYYHATNQSLSAAAVSARLSASEAQVGSGLQVQPADVTPIGERTPDAGVPKRPGHTCSLLLRAGNCPEENPLHYRWPESRPTATQILPCFPNKDQSTSRTCWLDPDSLAASWSPADLGNCTAIDTIQVSAANAAEVADQLSDITSNELTNQEVGQQTCTRLPAMTRLTPPPPPQVSQVVMKVKQLVGVANISGALASTVVTILSNVLSSSETALAPTSETCVPPAPFRFLLRALKTVDELVQKLEFQGPSISITSRHLAVGVSSFSAATFNGTSFSAFLEPNTSEPQIHFEDRRDPLAQVTLPASLLSGAALTEAELSSTSRINFMFFSSTNLFQVGRALVSYVVASSVGNLSIRDLMEPVRIQIAHLSEQEVLSPVCVFWDFSMSGGAGGWNGSGCRVSAESTSSRTVCLCDHLTHFGILLVRPTSTACPRTSTPQNNQILTFITYVGCGISSVFSAATLLTYIAFEKLRRDYPSKILMNLSTSLLFLNMVFLLDGWLASLHIRWLCLGVAALLHYFLLTSFTWMGLESIHMYIALVKVFNTYIRRYILKFCIVGWGLPALLVGIVVASDKDSYGPKENDTAPSAASEFCWIKAPLVFYTTCVGYFCLVFLLNVAMFVVVMLQICGRNGKRSNRTLREEVLRNLRSVVSLTFLLGMTWGFALFAWGPVSLAFMYLFSIFNSLQGEPASRGSSSSVSGANIKAFSLIFRAGLFIFIFHCALKENVQKQWRRYLCCGRFRLSENSDWSKTATNNTKKVSSEHLGKSVSSSSCGSGATSWTSKAKAGLNPFSKRHSSAEVQPNSSSSSSSSSSSILPVSQMIDKVKDYCSTRSDNFYKNILMSDSFTHSTKF
ncbi:unnamed protein product, partial [Tetraodon nigroviridis]